MIVSTNGHICVTLNQIRFNEYICDWLGVVHVCYIFRTGIVYKNSFFYQRGPCNDIVSKSDDESGFGGYAKNAMKGLHCFITEEERVPCYSSSDHDL